MGADCPHMIPIIDDLSSAIYAAPPPRTVFFLIIVWEGPGSTKWNW
jgi:hypothetical protein